MKESVDLTEVRKQLPHGAIVEIAKRAGVLTPTVSRALYGDKRSPKLPEIIKAVAEFLAEYKAREQAAIKAFNEVMKYEGTEHINA